MRLEEYWETVGREVVCLAFWRDWLAEILGAFFYVSIQVALLIHVVELSGDPDTDATLNIILAIATGLGMAYIVSIMGWALGDFGGGHFNPAITFAQTLLLKCTIFRGFMYIIGQCLGAMAGAAFIFAVTPESHRGNLGNTVLGPGVDKWQGVVMEAWLTGLVVLAVLGSLNKRRKKPVLMPTMFIGFAIGIAIFQTGGSMNPARSLGPAVVLWTQVKDDDGRADALGIDLDKLWDEHWIYWVGPLTGSGVASLIYFLIDIVDRPKSTNIVFFVRQML